MNRNTSLTLFLSILLILTLSASSYVVTIQNNSKIKELHKKIDALQLDIQTMNETITRYSIERYEMTNITEPSDTHIKILSDEPSHPDLLLLARLIESESGNQTYEGKLAVGTVVMNRVDSDEFPDTIEDVIFQKGQFSVVPNGTINNEPSDDSLKAAKEILEGKRTLKPDVLYFYNPQFTSKTNWIRSRKIHKVIDDHRFTI